MLSHISFTPAVLTLKYPSDIMHLKYNSRFTVMPLPSLDPRLSQELAVTSTWVKKSSPKKPLSNGPLLYHTTVLKNVVSSVAEAEFGALFVNAKEGTITRTTLSEMGHNQDAIELKAENTTADVIINNTVQQKRSKAIDKRFDWVKYRVEQDQFNVGWAPDDTNMGDYLTKHHSPAHQKCMRPYYLHDKHSPMIRHDTQLTILRGCVDISPSS
jgi:hypothetical protein